MHWPRLPSVCLSLNMIRRLKQSTTKAFLRITQRVYIKEDAGNYVCNFNAKDNIVPYTSRILSQFLVREM